MTFIFIVSAQVSVRVDVERQIGDIRPAIKTEIKKMGVELSEKSAQIQNVLNEFDGSLQARKPLLEILYNKK